MVVGRRETRRRTASTWLAELEEKEELRKRFYEVKKKEGQHEKSTPFTSNPDLAGKYGCRRRVTRRRRKKERNYLHTQIGRVLH